MSTKKEHAEKYPLHAKLAGLQVQQRIAQEFLELLHENGYVIATYDEATHKQYSSWSSGLWQTQKRPAEIIGEFLGIDAKVLSDEKDRMYEELWPPAETSDAE